MQSSLKKEWTKEILSGKYKIISNRLRTKEGFCPLGILAHLIDPNAWIYEDMRSFSVSLEEMFANPPYTRERGMGLWRWRQNKCASIFFLSTKILEQRKQNKISFLNRTNSLEKTVNWIRSNA